MNLTTLGPPLFANRDALEPTTRIASVLPAANLLITLHGIHAFQRMDGVAALQAQRRAAGLPALTEAEEASLLGEAVDLVLEGPLVLIRPDPERMDLAFAADALLQQIVPASRIRFKFARHPLVRDALCRRGEMWRIAPTPRTCEEILATVAASRIAVGGRPIYHYAASTGTRWLTQGDFRSLSDLPDAELAAHLQEIATLATRRNQREQPEVALLGAPADLTVARLMDGLPPARDPVAQRAWHAQRSAAFTDAVPPDLCDERPGHSSFRNALFGVLHTDDDHVADLEGPAGLGPEYYRQVHWLPGARVEDSELVIDPALADARPPGPGGEYVGALIGNYVREFGRLAHVNIGRLEPSLRQHRDPGLNLSFLALIQPAHCPRVFVRVIRFQKWDIARHLDRGKDLLTAILEAEEYAEFITQRRLACHHLDLPVPADLGPRRIHARYGGANARYRGARIWHTYYEREYLAGTATDKIAAARYRDPAFRTAFARLLGQAAASNLIVGRTSADGRPMFDDGDEILQTGADGQPTRLVAADHAGTFGDVLTPCDRVIAAYAQPVRIRCGLLDGNELEQFGADYAQAFDASFRRVQDRYRRRRRTFDALFRDSKQGEGAFGWRWERVLERLDHADPAPLAAALRDALQAVPA